MFNFNTSCICKIKKHRKKSIIVTGNSCTYLCGWCIRLHMNLIQNNEPLKFCCTHDILRYGISRGHYWNTPTTHFCDRCINYQIGQHLGHCWYCNNCNTYLMNYVDGRNVILYTTKDTSKNNGNFTSCKTCGSLWLIYDNMVVISCCNNSFI